MNETESVGIEQGNSYLQQQISELLLQVKLLTEENLMLRQRLFGRSSEKRIETLSDGQISLFNEAEVESLLDAQEKGHERITYTRKKPKGKRELDFSGLPVERVLYELPESGCVCPDCGNTLHACGHDVLRRELTVIPAQYKVTEHVQTVYSCRHCEATGVRTPMVKADVPAPVVKGSGIASPSLVAHIANQKYCLALPLYRQEQEFARNELTLSRQTMANWLIYVSAHWLYPIYRMLKTLLITAKVLHADETTVQVLKEEGKRPESKSYMWLYRTGCDAKYPIVLYEYQPNRKHENAKQFLTGFSGYLHSDGYGAYHNLPPDIVTIGCWAHVRRKFTDILKSLPDYNKPGSIAMRGKEYCDALFALERKYAELSFEQRKEARLVRSKPIMDEFFAWAENSRGSILATPRSVTGKALAYALSQRVFLENVLLDGRLEISNNRAERGIRPFTIGRKNWIFSNSEKGATASSMIYSILETAKENNLKPYEYLKHIFETAPNLDPTDTNAWLKLLPWNAPNMCLAPLHLSPNGVALSDA